MVIVLAKAPVAGRVKTRLCPPATPEQASEVAAAALLDTIETVCGVPGVRVVVALTGDLRTAARGVELDSALRGTMVLAQRGDTLGARIAAAHADTARVAPGLPTLLVGMDTPQADAELIRSCLSSLTTEDGPDAVLGTATDGGWWALGLREPRWAALLAQVPTSQVDTGARTLAALRAAGLRVDPLPELTDVDTAADAAAVAARIPGSRFAAAVVGL